MGAVTALKISQDTKYKDRVKALILDSPFSEFQTVTFDLILSQYRIPLCILKLTFYYLCRLIRKKINLDLREL